MTAPIAPPVVGQILVSVHADGNVSFQANIPSLNHGVMMLERAKLELYERMRKQETEAASSPLIERPAAGFDHTKIPTGDKLRTAA